KINQMGEAVGIENIEPPLRLSVTPYISTYFENEGNWNKDFNAGMDLKWGINQSFTLDMILIPDFGQVQSDDKVLNLSPFEVKYNEKRAFFTEGTELFNKAEILYSRRIGSRPKRAKDVDDILLKNEVVQTNPIETKLINATKISGRTSKGLGIGFLNAITDAADAEIKDTITNKTRLYRTQSFTNYNMLVLDQTLKNNSYISLANTNVLQPEDNYMANVTGTEFKIKNKENSYQFFGRAALSQIYTNTNSFGHKYLLIFSKTRGNYLFDLIHNTESNTYDPNDMGYIRRNNKSIWRTNLKYNKNEPFWKVLNWHNELTIYYQNLYKPRKYNDFFIRFSSNTTFTKSYFHTGITFKVKPFSTFDYFEPRDPKFIQKFKRPKLGVFNWWASSDYRKRLAFDLNFGAREDWEKDYNSYGYWFKLAPRVRITDKWLFVYSFKGDNNFKSYGYVDSYDDSNGNRLTDFGKRDQYTFTHTLNTSYIFNSNMSVNLRIRHYWSRVKYLDFYTLQPDGSMGESLGYEKYGNDKDYNYNAFTIDMKYLWRFAPGSEIALVWKNSIYADQNDIINNAWDNLNNTLETSQINSLSFKLLYYLDYQYLAKSRKHNK
ncbi:MAG: DUF5916 domain-containing protein, partial [Bacteroidales bacterium]|nr:DUF5916 domain-containing protein [Bacteroidales bacterium]